MKMASAGQWLELCHWIFTPIAAKMPDETILAWFSSNMSSMLAMQTVTRGSAAGPAPAGTLVQTIAAITATPVIFIAVSTSAATGGSERENRPWPWYFLLRDCDRADSIRGSHWFTKGLERRRPSGAGAAGGPGVQRAAPHSPALHEK